MRINCKKIPKHKLTEQYLHHKYIIIETEIVFKRYCGIFENKYLNHVYAYRKGFGFVLNENRYFFPYEVLKEECNVYEISQNDYKLFTKCKNGHDFNVLWDNLYFENE